MRTSNWTQATVPLHCPSCFALDLPPPAKPTLEREQDKSITCTVCGYHWRPGETPPKESP